LFALARVPGSSQRRALYKFKKLKLLPMKCYIKLHFFMAFLVAVTSCSERDIKKQNDEKNDPLAALKSELLKEQAVAKPETNSDGDWLGLDVDFKGGSGPTPLQEKIALAGEERAIKDVKVTSLDLPGESILECMQWSPDGKYVCILSEDGVLRKVAYPSLQQELILEIGGKAGWMQLCKYGILVGVESLGQIWLIDGTTLEVKRQFAAPGVGWYGFTSSLNSTAVYVSDDNAQKLIMIDIKTGTPVQEFSARALQSKFGNTIKKHPDSVVLTDMSFPTMSSDGKYFFCVGFECLHRFKVSGTDLIYEEMGPRIGSNAQRIYVDPESRYVAMPSGGGNGQPEGHPNAGSYVTYVYRVSDLSRPVIALEGGAYPGCIALDRVSKNVYLDNYDYQIMVFTPKGLKQQNYALTENSDDVRQFLVHPDGGKLLVLTESALKNVEIPR
jgi:WD40 repeat protein